MSGKAISTSERRRRVEQPRPAAGHGLRWLAVFLVLLGLVIVPACGGGGGGGATADAALASDAAACSENDPRAVPIELAIEPEAGEAPFVDVLGRAQRSIRVMVYLMGMGGILDALKSKAGEGKTVHVILDQSQKDTNQKYFDQLAAAGAEVRWSDPKFTYMHAKLIVVDEAEAVISTGNYSVYQMRQERNFVAHDDDPQDIADLVALFDADWERSPPDLSCTRLLVSPVNARQRILALIRGASRSLLVESMQFADKDVRGAVAARKQAGVEVRVLLADPSWIDANQDAATFLAGQGIEARWLAHLHVKAIVVDGLRAYTGSENLSYTSLSKNREVGLIFADHGAVQPMVDTFEKDWALATPF